MTVERLIWLAPALLSLGGSLYILWPRKQNPRGPWMLAVTLIVAAAIVACFAWLAFQISAWPGAALAERLGLLALGALLALAWRQAFRAGSFRSHPADQVAEASVQADAQVNAPERSRGREWGAGAVLASAAVLLVAAAWAAVPAAIASEATVTGIWLFGWAQIAAGVGLGGWLTVFALSAATRGIAGAPGAAELPLGLTAVRTPAIDEGRAAALFSFPWLTLAWLLASAWNLAAHATIWRNQPGELWLVVAWLLAGAYLHLTSSWRPLDLPGWLPTLTAGLVFAAALFAAASGASL